MAPPNHNSPEVLREEILADARRESEAIVRRAQQDAESLLARAAAEADQVRRERLDQARSEAARRTELILATVPVEVARQRAARVEALLQSIRDEIRHRLLARDGFDYRDAVMSLAAEAIQRMSGNSFVLKLSATDHEVLGDGLAEEIARRVARSPLSVTISNSTPLAGDGVLVQDLEDRQECDNRLEARLDRLWPELRRRIAVRAALVAPVGTTGGGA